MVLKILLKRGYITQLVERDPLMKSQMFGYGNLGETFEFRV